MMRLRRCGLFRRDGMAGARWAGVLLLAFGSAAVQAQENTAAVAPSWTIKPTANLDFTATDNATPGRGEKRDEFITRVSPGVRIEAASARLKGSLAYQWHQNFYANNSVPDGDQQSLRADGRLELVEQLLFVDASANIAQQPISAFGTQGVGNELANANRSETTSWQWSPYLKGNLGSTLQYEMRYRFLQTDTKAGVQAQYGDTLNHTWSGRLGGATPLARLGWSVSAEQQNIEVGTRSELRSERLLGSLDYRIDARIKLSLLAGGESDNYNLAELRSRRNVGAGFEWTPTERTLLSLQHQRRSYGDDFNLIFNHRTALSSWRLSDSRSVVLPGQQNATAPTSAAYALLDQQLSRAYPDAAERAGVVMQTLQQLGISADALVYGNLFSAQPFIQRRQEASMTLTGANNTVTLTLQRSTSDRLGTGVGLVDDFATSANIRQSGLSGSWAHKLSPHSTLTFNTVASRSEGDSAAQETQLKSLSVLLTTRLGHRTSATAGLRQTQFDRTVGEGYDEQALTGSLGFIF